MKHCRGCNEPIAWVTMVRTSASMPLNTQHDDAGTIAVDDSGRGYMVRADSPTVPRYVPHWSTCPERKRFKNKKAATT